jgi:hypothetical protein
LQGHLKCFASFRHNSTWQQANYVVSSVKISLGVTALTKT